MRNQKRRMGSPWYILVVFSLATFWLYILSSAISYTITKEKTQIHFPRSLEQLREVAKLLREWNEANHFFVFILFCSAYLYKQTFAIPGSVFLNILSGALFGVWVGFLLCCFLTAAGASCCFLLSNWCLKGFITRRWPDRIGVLRDKVDANAHRLFWWLLSFRLFPGTPNWFLNVSSPIVGIPIHIFFLTAFVGLMPYNFLGAQTGSIISEVDSLNDIVSTENLVKMFVMATVAFCPSFFVRKRMK